MDNAVVNFLSQFIQDDRQNLIKQVLSNRTRYLTVCLEDIYHPHNASAVLRTCDCMMMRYIPELDMIVFDHLSPSRPEYAGDLRFYGPDFSYDGFKFIKGVWVLQSDLDLRNSFHPKLKILPQPPKVN